MINYIQLLRPLQWLKNIFVFAPIFFSNNLLEINYFTPTFFVFISFCFISSSIYCFNDIRDAESDRQHPQKCKRPIASGAVSIVGGYTMMAICCILAFAVILFVASPNSKYLFLIIGGYWLMNIAYCLKLKLYAILDVSIIAVGFVIRVLIGGLAANIWVSQWLVLMTFLLSLFLALAKRRDDFSLFEQTGKKSRVSITGYNKEFIDEAIGILLAITMVCYIMYTMSEEVIERIGSEYLYLTSIWVLVGLFRYMQKTIVYGDSGSPTKILYHDHFIQMSIIGWIVSFFIIIYF